MHDRAAKWTARCDGETSRDVLRRLVKAGYDGIRVEYDGIRVEYDGGGTVEYMASSNIAIGI